MKGQLELINSLLHLKIADGYMMSFKNDNPNTRGASLFAKYSAKINWIFNDMITNPALPRDVVDGIKKDLDSDVMVLPALVEKIAMLTPDNRLSLEVLVESLINGEKIIVDTK